MHDCVRLFDAIIQDEGRAEKWKQVLQDTIVHKGQLLSMLLISWTKGRWNCARTCFSTANISLSFQIAYTMWLIPELPQEKIKCIISIKIENQNFNLYNSSFIPKQKYCCIIQSVNYIRGKAFLNTYMKKKTMTIKLSHLFTQKKTPPLILNTKCSAPFSLRLLPRHAYRLLAAPKFHVPALHFCSVIKKRGRRNLSTSKPRALAMV